MNVLLISLSLLTHLSVIFLSFSTYLQDSRLHKQFKVHWTHLSLEQMIALVKSTNGWLAANGQVIDRKSEQTECEVKYPTIK